MTTNKWEINVKYLLSNFLKLRYVFCLSALFWPLLGPNIDEVWPNSLLLGRESQVSLLDKSGIIVLLVWTFPSCGLTGRVVCHTKLQIKFALQFANLVVKEDKRVAGCSVLMTARAAARIVRWPRRVIHLYKVRN